MKRIDQSADRSWESQIYFYENNPVFHRNQLSKITMQKRQRRLSSKS